MGESAMTQSQPGASAAVANNAKIMNRYDLTFRLVASLKRGEAVIGGIGNSNFYLWTSGQRPENCYLLGSMGLACPIALGVAIAQPKRQVFALEGVGSLLMQLGCQTTIAVRAPKNLCIIVFDNGIYQITGALLMPAIAYTILQRTNTQSVPTRARLPRRSGAMRKAGDRSRSTPRQFPWRSSIRTSRRRFSCSSP